MVYKASKAFDREMTDGCPRVIETLRTVDAQSCPIVRLELSVLQVAVAVVEA